MFLNILLCKLVFMRGPPFKKGGPRGCCKVTLTHIMTPHAHHARSLVAAPRHSSPRHSSPRLASLDRALGSAHRDGLSEYINHSGRHARPPNRVALYSLGVTYPHEQRRRLCHPPHHPGAPRKRRGVAGMLRAVRLKTFFFFKKKDQKTQLKYIYLRTRGPFKKNLTLIKAPYFVAS